MCTNTCNNTCKKSGKEGGGTEATEATEATGRHFAQNPADQDTITRLEVRTPKCKHCLGNYVILLFSYFLQKKAVGCQCMDQ